MLGSFLEHSAESQRQGVPLSTQPGGCDPLLSTHGGRDSDVWLLLIQWTGTSSTPGSEVINADTTNYVGDRTRAVGGALQEAAFLPTLGLPRGCEQALKTTSSGARASPLPDSVFWVRELTSLCLFSPLTVGLVTTKHCVRNSE